MRSQLLRETLYEELNKGSIETRNQESGDLEPVKSSFSLIELNGNLEDIPVFSLGVNDYKVTVHSTLNVLLSISFNGGESTSNKVY